GPTGASLLKLIFALATLIPSVPGSGCSMTIGRPRSSSVVIATAPVVSVTIVGTANSRPPPLNDWFVTSGWLLSQPALYFVVAVGSCLYALSNAKSTQCPFGPVARVMFPVLGSITNPMSSMFVWSADLFGGSGAVNFAAFS